MYVGPIWDADAAETWEIESGFPIPTGTNAVRRSREASGSCENADVDPSIALIVGALIGGIAGVGGAWLTNRANTAEHAKEREHARQLERERWDREDRIRRDELDQARRERWLAEKREVVARVIRNGDHGTALAVGMRIDYTAPLREATDAIAEMNQARAEIKILAPDLADAAFAFYTAATELVLYITTQIHEQNLKPDPDEVDRLSKNYWQAQQAFVAAAQADLSPEI